MNNWNYLHKLQDLRTELHRQFIEEGKMTGWDIDQINKEIDAIFSEAVTV